MREIRQLNKAHIDAYSDIAFNAYPSFKDLSSEAVKKYKDTVAHIMETDPNVTFYGMFEDEKLIAVMRLFDFTMNYFGHSDIRYVENDDIKKLLDCHSRVAEKTHGMIIKINDEIRELFIARKNQFAILTFKVSIALIKFIK